MKEHSTYIVPEAQPIVLKPQGTLLNLSNFGNDNAPGQAFDGGNIINNPLDF